MGGPVKPWLTVTPVLILDALLRAERAELITPGSTWTFQFWYRDLAAGGAGFNLSNELSATFCP
jgi:hypothetical protein